MSAHYTLVKLERQMIGGHYAAQDAWGRTIGERWRLDRDSASTLCEELNRAVKLGQTLTTKGEA